MYNLGYMVGVEVLLSRELACAWRSLILSKLDEFVKMRAFDQGGNKAINVSY